MAKLLNICVLVLVAVVAFAATINAERWTNFCEERGSCPEVGIDIAITSGRDPCMVGGYASSRDEAHAMGIYCATYQNPEGLTRLNHSRYGVAGMPVSAFGSQSGAVFSAGMGFLNYSSGLWYSHDREYVHGSDKFFTVGQDIKVVQNGAAEPSKTHVAFVGSLDFDSNIEGILMSTDGGATYNPVDVNPEMTHLRYGSWLQNDKESFWIVSAGDWPSSMSRQQEDEDNKNRCIRLSAVHCQKAPRAMSSFEIAKRNKKVYHPIRQATRNIVHPASTSGLFGQLYRSRDFGLTWEKVFDTSEFYFNDIACSDFKNCHVVAERDNMATVFVTTDGGDTWVRKLTLESQLMVSLFRARAVKVESREGTINELWVTGGMWDDAAGGLVGLIYRSVDGGDNWTLINSIPDVGIVVGLACADDAQVCYALGSTQSQQTIVSRFDRN